MFLRMCGGSDRSQQIRSESCTISSEENFRSQLCVELRSRVFSIRQIAKPLVWPLEWNGVADTTSLFQKYSLRKGRPATDYADVIGPRIKRLMLFPKFELVEQPRSGFVSLPIFSSRDFALLRVADYAVHVNFTVGKHCGVYGGKLFGLFGPIDFVRLNRAILVLLGLAGSND